MRHFVDLWAVTPDTKNPAQLKEIAFNDFYLDGDGKFGTVQSFGPLPPVPMMLASMEEDIRSGPLPRTIFLFKLLKPFMGFILRGLFRRSVVFASIMEDAPDNANQVSIGPDGQIQIRYRMIETDKRKLETFRKKIRRAFKPYPAVPIKQAENNERLAHAAGTCRMGLDPKSSVVDAACRAHGLENLYIVDASFFPTSAGTNPALTLAANALRVADQLLGKGSVSLDPYIKAQPS